MRSVSLDKTLNQLKSGWHNDPRDSQMLTTTFKSPWFTARCSKFVEILKSLDIQCAVVGNEDLDDASFTLHITKENWDKLQAYEFPKLQQVFKTAFFLDDFVETLFKRLFLDPVDFRISQTIELGISDTILMLARDEVNSFLRDMNLGQSIVHSRPIPMTEGEIRSYLTLPIESSARDILFRLRTKVAAGDQAEIARLKKLAKEAFESI